MDIDTILKQAEQETVLYNKLQKAAEQLEAENPELAGQVIPMLDDLSDEDLDLILAGATGETEEEQQPEAKPEEGQKAEGATEEQKAETDEETVAKEETTSEGETEEETSEEASEESTEESAGGEQEVAKAASESVTEDEAGMIDKIAEANVLAEYIGTKAIDAMVKRAAAYGITIQTPEADALEAVATEMGEKIAASLIPALGEKLASTEELDEKTAQELYDIGRLACIGRLYLEELQSGDNSDS